MPRHGTIPRSANPSALAPATTGKGESPAQLAPAWPRAGGLAVTFRSLRHRNYRLYFFGQLVSLTGTWMQAAALDWLAYDLTHQSKWPALLTAAQIVPTFLFGVWGGALADRWPKRSLIFAMQSAFALLAFLLAGLVLGGVVAPWQLLAVTAAAGLVQAIDLPARLAFVMDMAGREDLMNAVALNSLLFNVARALGPALAGLLLLYVQPWACFLTNGLSYLAVLWALACMDVSGSVRTREADRGLRALLNGFHYLAGHRELAFLVVLAGTTALFGWPFVALLPALAKNHLGSAEFGYSLMVSGTGVGALAAAWTLATFGSVEHRGTLLGTGVGVVSSGLVGLALAPVLALAVACCGLVGFGLVLFLATSQSVVQLSTAEHNRGRILAIWAMTLSGAVPLGNLLAGPAADLWGEPLVLGLLGAACAMSALALYALFRPRKANHRDTELQRREEAKTAAE